MDDQAEHDDSASETECPPPMKQSQAGAATYKTRFNAAWTKEFDFISSVRGDPHK